MLYTLVFVVFATQGTTEILVEREFKTRESCHAVAIVLKEMAETLPFRTVRYRCIEEKF
jgi:hypothetical protein